MWNVRSELTQSCDDSADEGGSLTQHWSRAVEPSWALGGFLVS